MALLYCNRISHSHIILAGWYHITNWYCKNLAFHLCTKWGILESDSNTFCSPLQLDSIVNSAPHKYFINFPISHLNAAASTTKLCIDFSSSDTVDIKMKEIIRRQIPSRDLSNSHFSPDFYCASAFLASTKSPDCRSTATTTSLD